MKDVYLILVDLTTGKQFRKYFDTEFEKDRFKRKLKFSRKIIVVGDSSDGELGG